MGAVEDLITRKNNLDNSFKELNALREYNEKQLYLKYENMFLEKREMIEEWNKLLSVGYPLNSFSHKKAPKTLCSGGEIRGDGYGLYSVFMAADFSRLTDKYLVGFGRSWGDCGQMEAVYFDINKVNNDNRLIWYIKEENATGSKTKDFNFSISNTYVLRAMCLKVIMDCYEGYKNELIKYYTDRLDEYEKNLNDEKEKINQILER